MEALLIYQVKVAVLVAALFGGYRLLLGRETFHRFNRLVLITIALLSFVLPLFHITRHSIAADNSGAVEENTQLVVSDMDTTAAQTSAPVNLFAILLVLYGAGVLFVLIKKGISVWTMSRIIRKGRYADRAEGVDVIESDQIPGPLNWMRFVVMPHEWLESENASVWKHENLHAHRWHSLDLLMADIMTAFQWFNPVMILLRKEFELIHEFEADRAVIDSGANPKEYKLMLVNAVAASRGLAMTSWLKQSNLKKRIDMMDKKQSNGWNRLRVLFVPAIAYFFLFATANVAMAEDSSFHWPVFEDGKTWIYQDGTCKVRTFNGVEASMKVSELADYLANYKDFKTTRMTLMYTYPIEGLAEVQPLAEQLVAKGIRISVANNDDILTQMTMPEYRAARIYDMGSGQYKFELNCNLKSNNRMAAMTGNSKFIDFINPSITGDIDLMKKWINLFDGHGVSIYPDKMSAKDADELAKATWDRGLEQFSIVTDMNDGAPRRDKIDRNVTIIPMYFSISQHYPGMDAQTAAKQMLYDYTEKYYSKGLHIADPKVFYNPEADCIDINLVNADDEFIMVFRNYQYRDQWVTGLSECEIEVNGQWIKETKNEGMDNFLNHYFWNPTYGYAPTTICCTRYGNVMGSRGSVIPLWIEQIKSGKPITITNPEMTRFMMTLDDAVDLVIYAWQHGDNGDLFVQKAPAATLVTLAQALKELYQSDAEVKVIGTRHGEKLYETLVTREEMAKAEDMGNYFRIPCDTRDLNYDKYFIEGSERINYVDTYHSHNTRRLDVVEMKELLKKLKLIREDLGLGDGGC